MAKIIIALDARQPCLTVQTTAEIVDTLADKSALVLTKKLVGCQQLDEIEAVDNSTQRITTLAHAPSMRRQLDKVLHELATERQRLVTAFLADYPELVKRDKKRLRDLYDLGDYPAKESLKKQFVFKWKFINT